MPSPRRSRRRTTAAAKRAAAKRAGARREGRLAGSNRAVGMWDRDHGQAIDASKVFRIAGVKGQAVSHRDGCDHGVVRSGRCLPARSPKRRRDSAECSCRIGIKRKRVEIHLSLLQVCEARCAFALVRRHQRTDGQLRQGDRRDERPLGEHRRIPQPTKQDPGARIEKPGLARGHSRGSSVSSRSARSESLSIGGSRRHRSSSAAAVRVTERSGRNSATGRPPRVTITCSPAATRSTTSPPWFRNSRMLTSAMLAMVSHVIHAALGCAEACRLAVWWGPDTPPAEPR